MIVWAQMASESADKSMWLAAEDFYVRYGTASWGTLFPAQLLTDKSFLCPKSAANFSVWRKGGGS